MINKKSDPKYQNQKLIGTSSSIMNFIEPPMSTKARPKYNQNSRNDFKSDFDFENGNSFDSETPLPKPPAPISPDSINLRAPSNRTQAIKAETSMMLNATKGNDFTSNGGSVHSEFHKSPSNSNSRTHESIDDFIEQKANSFLNTLKSNDDKYMTIQQNNSNELKNILSQNKYDLTPTRTSRAHVYKTLAKTPEPSSIPKKFQINRPKVSPEKLLKTEKKQPKPLENSGVLKNSNIAKSPEVSPFKSEESRKLKYRPMSKQVTTLSSVERKNTKKEMSQKKDENLIDIIKSKIDPFVSILTERIGINRPESDKKSLELSKSCKVLKTKASLFELDKDQSENEPEHLRLSKDDEVLITNEMHKPIPKIEPDSVIKNLFVDQLDDIKPELAPISSRKLNEEDKAHDQFFIDDTISFNDSKMSPEKEQTNIPDYFTSVVFPDPDPKRPKSVNPFIVDIESQSDESEKNLSVNHNDDYALLGPKFKRVSSTDVKQSSKKIITENLLALNKAQSFVPFKNISKMKSKLPESHLPNHNHEAKKEENLADKLQAMQHKTENSEEESNHSRKFSTEEPKPEPKFLTLDMTHESLEELARIDAELAQ